MGLRLFAMLLLLGASAFGETMRAQEAQDSALVFVPQGSSFSGDIALDSAGVRHLQAGQYLEVQFPNFALHRKLVATPNDHAMRPGEFSADDFSYGQNRYFEVTTVAGAAVLREIRETGGLCGLIGLKRVGDVDRNIDPDQHSLAASCAAVKDSLGTSDTEIP